MRWQESDSSSNVEDRRGMRSAGMGLGGLLIILVGAYFGLDLRGLVGPGGPIPQQQRQQVGQAPQDGYKEFASHILGMTEQVWDAQFREHGLRYEHPRMVLFSDSVQTGCGNAPSSVGPFYCPADQTVYLDPTFFRELQQTLGGSQAEFSQAYVIGHEVGHHVQNLLGYNGKLKSYERREGKNAGIRLELQADYLAGVWAHYAEKRWRILEPGDVEAALTTAKAIGDDRIQKRSQGWVSPESFTHGSAAQRLKHFREGLQTGDFSKKKLDTFFDPNVDPLRL
ncbi:MAG: neutral zinc metallopeptidase [Bacteroidales bacterium]|nr:neutral zinc metallopeptidase [Bacteroidales bacterium]